MKTKRYFIPGDKWIYYRIYTGKNIADKILTEFIGPLTNDLLQKGYIEKWFYIRYQDPDFHLRLRFELKSDFHLYDVIHNFNNRILPYKETGTIWKIDMGTYERELERYGGNTIEICEELFYYDSILCFNFLNNLSNENEENQLNKRWLFSIVSIDHLLDLFHFNINEKLDLLDFLRKGYESEFGVSNSISFKKSINKQYREHSVILKNFFEDLTDSKNINYEILFMFKTSSNNCFSRILSLKSKTVSKKKLASALIHMRVNRLFSSKNRQNELVCLDYLYKYNKTKLYTN